MDLSDVIKDIALPFLPAKALIRFQAVSKDWHRWIKSPFLAHQQSHHFNHLSGFFTQSNGQNPTFVTLNDHAYGVPETSLSFLPEPVNIISSCNGLLLVQSRDDINNSYYVCNPANKEWRVITRPDLYHGPEPSTLIAFNPSPLNIVAHYKLVCAVPIIGHSTVLFEIYSSKKGSWRVSKCELVTTEGSEMFSTGNSGLYFKGVAYWETTERKVVAFDIKNDVCDVISLPCGTDGKGVLTQIKGELSYVTISRDFLGNKDDGYFLRIYGGMDLTLKKQVSLSLQSDGSSMVRGCRVLPCLDGGDVVMILVGCLIYSFRASDGSIEVVTRVGNGGSYFSIGTHKYLAYVNSLVNVSNK